MTKGRKIILLVCMCLLGACIIFAMFMHKREIAKYTENGTVAKARVTRKESEEVTEGRSTHSNNWIHIALPINGDTLFEMCKSEYVDDDIYAATKKGMWIDVIYFKDQLTKDERGNPELIGGDIMMKDAMDAAAARLPWYWLYGGVCIFLGALPYIIGALRKKKK